MVSVISGKLHNKIIENVVYVLLILLISNTAQVCFEPVFRYAVLLLFSLLFLFKRRKIDFIVIVLFFCSCFINILFSAYSSEILNIYGILGYLLPLYIAYFAMKVIGPSFWEKLEKWIYVLTCISLIVYVGNLVFPSLYNNLSSIFGAFIADYYKEARPSVWYAFVYTYFPPFEGINYTRNSGFMWEPGGFAMVSIFGFIYTMCKNGMNLNKRSCVYIIAILTTFSSAGYISIMLFFLYYFISKKNVWFTLALLVLVVGIIPAIIQLEFIGSKIMTFQEEAHTNTSFYNPRLDMQEYNRFSVFEINMKQLIKWPFGYGGFNVKDDYGMEFAGVNGIAVFARTWGVLGLCLLIYSIRRTFRYFDAEITKIAAFIFMCMVLILFFSNPIEKQLIVWFFCLTPFIYKRNMIL